IDRLIQIAKGGAVRFHEENIRTGGHRVRPLDVQRYLKRPPCATRSGRVGRWIIGGAVLSYLAKPWGAWGGGSVVESKIGDSKLPTKRQQIAVGCGRVIGINDGDGLSGAVALYAIEKDLIQSISASHLRRR